MNDFEVDSDEAYPQTAYDHPSATDGAGGPHPLAGVPQDVLDAARASLAEAVAWEKLPLDAEEVEAIAHAVLAAAVTQLRSSAERPEYRSDVEWGVRWPHGIIHRVPGGEETAWEMADQKGLLPFTRSRTKYADRVTEWVEVPETRRPAKS